MRLASVACLLAAGCVTVPTMVPVEPPPTRYFCRYSLNPYYLQDGALRLPGEDAPFARFRKAQKAGVELVIPHGARADAMSAVFTTGWVTLRAVYAPERAMSVSSKVPIALSPVLQWPAGASVRLEGIDGDAFVVSLERPDELLGEVPLRARLDCTETSVGWVAHSFTDEASGDDDAEEDSASDERWEIPAGTEVPFSESPGGPVLERFLDRKGATPVRVLAIEGARAKVRAEAWPARLLGWVPREKLKKSEPEGASGIFGGLGVLGSAGEGRGTPDYPRCGTRAPLALRFAGRIHEIGQLNKNAAYVETARGDGYVEVRLPEIDWIRLEPGAAWMLTAEAAAACKVPEKKEN